MTSPQLWKAFSLYGGYFQRFIKLPFSYNQQTRKIEHISDWRELVPMLIIILVLGGVLFLSTVTVLYLQITQGAIIHIPFFNLMVMLMFQSISNFVFSIALLGLFYGQRFVEGVNGLVILERNIRTKGAPESSYNADLVGKILCWTVPLFSIYPIPITVHVMLQKLEPYSPIYDLVFHPNPSDEVFNMIVYGAFVAFKAVATFAITFVTMGGMCIVFLFAIIVCDLSVNLLKGFIASSTVSKYLKFANEGKITLNNVSTAADYGIFSTMAMGLGASVTFNWASIKGHGLIPMPFYLSFPPVAVLIPFVIHYTFSPAIQINELAITAKSERIRSLTSMAGGSKIRKYWRIKIQAVDPGIAYGGMNGFRFYKMTKSTRLGYYDSISNYTFTALLSIKT